MPQTHHDYATQAAKMLSSMFGEENIHDDGEHIWIRRNALKLLSLTDAHDFAVQFTLVMDVHKIIDHSADECIDMLGFRKSDVTKDTLRRLSEMTLDDFSVDVLSESPTALISDAKTDISKGENKARTPAAEQLTKIFGMNVEERSLRRAGLPDQEAYMIPVGAFPIRPIYTNTPDITSDIKTYSNAVQKTVRQWLKDNDVGIPYSPTLAGAHYYSFADIAQGMAAGIKIDKRLADKMHEKGGLQALALPNLWPKIIAEANAVYL